MTDRCPICDRPIATADLDGHPGGCECEACVSVCWYGPDRCTGEPVDWRARALAAERERDAVREAIIDAHRSYRGARADADELVAERDRLASKVARLERRLADDAETHRIIWGALTPGLTALGICDDGWDPPGMSARIKAVVRTLTRAHDALDRIITTGSGGPAEIADVVLAMGDMLRDIGDDRARAERAVGGR